jgi:Cu(I)/Ag(I) efflux system membrane fusion protein
MITRKLSALIAVAGISILAGYWLGRTGGSASVEASRKPLYYHDPMHPSYRSDKPGIAPDCGMALEPVYAEGASPGTPAAAPGSVPMSAETQQRAGVQTARVERASGSYTVRLLGRVAADESRIHRVSALADGVIRAVAAQAVGNLVAKDEFLARYFVSSPELYSAVQNYFLAMSARDRGLVLNSTKDAPDDAQVRLAEELLQSYGVTKAQLLELAHTRRPTRDIEFRAPVAGLVLARNAAPGQRAERGSELFRIAELSRVWVLADLFENDSRLIRAGEAAKVRYRGQTYRTQISDASQFDPASRTLKIRLELDNPQALLRPDMFVDVEVQVAPPPGLAVPADALVDSGLRRAVYVRSENGAFEPREVAAGTRYGDRVQILQGLEEGETIAVSGLFLLDSESRLRMIAAPLASRKTAAAPGRTIDPICGMEVDPAKTAHRSEFQGTTYYFCSQDCRKQFDANPARYAKKGGRS